MNCKTESYFVIMFSMVGHGLRITGLETAVIQTCKNTYLEDPELVLESHTWK